MKGVEASERRERAAQEAADWMLRLCEDMSRSERLEYVVWLRESPLHVAEMLRVAGAHRRLTEFEGWEKIPPADSDALMAEVHTFPSRKLLSQRLRFMRVLLDDVHPGGGRWRQRLSSASLVD